MPRGSIQTREILVTGHERPERLHALYNKYSGEQPGNVQMSRKRCFSHDHSIYSNYFENCWPAIVISGADRPFLQYLTASTDAV